LNQYGTEIYKLIRNNVKCKCLHINFICINFYPNLKWLEIKNVVWIFKCTLNFLIIYVNVIMLFVFKITCNRIECVSNRSGKPPLSQSWLNRFNKDAKTQIVPLFQQRADLKQIVLCSTSYWNALRVSERRNWDGNKSDNKGATATRL